MAENEVNKLKAERVAMLNKKINTKIFDSKITIRFTPITISENLKLNLVNGMNAATDVPNDTAAQEFAAAVNNIGLMNLGMYPEETIPRVIEASDELRPVINELKSNFQEVQRQILKAAGLLSNPNMGRSSTQTVDAGLEAIVDCWNDFSDDEKENIVKKDGKAYSLFRIEYLKKRDCPMPQKASEWADGELARREAEKKKKAEENKTKRKPSQVNSNTVPYAALIQTGFKTDDVDTHWAYYRVSGMKNKAAAIALKTLPIKVFESYIKPEVSLDKMATLPMNYITKDKLRRVIAGSGCFEKDRLACDIPSLQYVVPKDVPKALGALASCLNYISSAGLGDSEEFSFRHSISKSTTRVMAGLVMYNRNRIPLRSIKIILPGDAQTGEVGYYHNIEAPNDPTFGIK